MPINRTSEEILTDIRREQKILSSMRGEIEVEVKP
jgi:hypothetical protein